MDTFRGFALGYGMADSEWGYIYGRLNKILQEVKWHSHGTITIIVDKGWCTRKTFLVLLT